jgi:tRNA A-37 threonylcarbamoyl transferase component Bud32
MATGDRKSALIIVRIAVLCFLTFALSVFSEAQQYSFFAVPDAPKGCFFSYMDRRGGEWLIGCETGKEGLFYFDGSRFIKPLGDNIPDLLGQITEDSEGGIWLGTTVGLFRVYRGNLEKILDGPIGGEIGEVAPDVFLASAMKSLPGPYDADAVRISRQSGHWKVETIIPETKFTHFRSDRSGHVLFGCPGGYCEVLAQDVLSWHPGTTLPVAHHPGDSDAVYSFALRDRFDCVWLRNDYITSYKCPGDRHFVTLAPDIATHGYSLLVEQANGDIVIPSWAELAVGRPGKFRIFTQKNGYPAGGPPIGGIGSRVFLGGAHYFQPHDRTEFWASAEGLDGNTWSITRAHGRMFAVAGDSIRVLSSDHTRWEKFASLPQAVFIIPGDDKTLFAASLTRGVIQFSATGKILRRSNAVQAFMLARTPDGRIWAQENHVSEILIRKNRLIFRSTGLTGGRCLKVDGRGRLWAANATGFGVLESSGWSWRSVRGGPRRQALTFDGHGDVWSATDSSFSFFPNPEDVSSRPVALPQANPFGFAYFLDRDRRGWLWRGNATGLYVADAEQARAGSWLRLESLGQLSIGADALDTNTNSFFEDTDGSIWFGAGSIILHLYVDDDLLHPREFPSVFISSLSWNGAAPRIADWVDEVKHGFDITAHIGCMQLDRRNALHLRYRLLPDEGSWRQSHDLDIHIGKLSWGRHTLEVEAQFQDGAWVRARSKTFLVLRPLWLSWPAIVGLLLISGCGAGVAYRQHKISRQRRNLTLPSLAEWRLAALSPEMSTLRDEVLDSRFRVGNVLARGGFATVAEGRDLLHGKACAIKIFRRELLENDWMTRRFQQEVMALERIRHGNVVAIYGHGTTPAGSPYLAMEFIHGLTLRERLAKGPLGSVRTASYLRQAGSALAEIHVHGICHRDLKPENLMIRYAAPFGLDLVLIDFSIAIVQDPDQTLHGLSRAAGTIYYMAPEQSIGYADSSTDIYSLAKIVIEMLTGHRLSTLLPDASMDLPERVSGLLLGSKIGMSRNSADLISAALEFDPSNRPKSAAEFASSIAMDLESLPDMSEGFSAD